MTSMILDVAGEGLLAKAGLSDLNTSVGDLNGKKTTHWSFYIFIAGSVVGAIAAIAGFVFGFLIPMITMGIPISLAGLCFGVTNGFAAIYVKKFGQLKTMEQYSKDINERVKVFAGKVTEFAKENQELKAVGTDLEKVPKDWKAQIEKGKLAIEEKTKELDAVTKRLLLVQQKLKKFSKIVEGMQAQTKLFSQETLAFSKENKLVGDHVVTLAKHVEGLDRENAEILAGITSLDVQNDQTEKVLAQFAEQNKFFQTNMAIRLQIFEAAKKQVEELKAKVEKLSVVVPQAVASADKVDHAAHDFQKILPVLEAKLEKAKGWKEDAKKWNAFVATPEGKKYLASTQGH